MENEDRVVLQHKNNFETLKKAFNSNEVALMDCIEKSTGEHVAVICAITFDSETKTTSFIPFAKFFNGNPYELLSSPLEYEN